MAKITEQYLKNKLERIKAALPDLPVECITLNSEMLVNAYQDKSRRGYRSKYYRLSCIDEKTGQAQNMNWWMDSKSMDNCLDTLFNFGVFAIATCKTNQGRREYE